MDEQVLRLINNRIDDIVKRLDAIEHAITETDSESDEFRVGVLNVFRQIEDKFGEVESMVKPLFMEGGEMN